MPNPLLRDRDVDFLLYDVLRADELTTLPAFAEHDRGTFDLILGSARRLARDVLFPAYKPLDEAPPRFVEGKVLVHPMLKELWPRLVELGSVVATRPASVGGQSLPLVVACMANAYLMAANLHAYGYIGLSSGAAHLLETFGSDELRERYMQKLYDGTWTGTMALTEPQAGSSLADVATRATPREDGTHLVSGNKIFISGGDHDLAENIVHLVLARIDGAPPGIKGVSLFCVPKRRVDADADAEGGLVDNDVTVTGLIHKIGWRGLPSLSLSFGDRGDCVGYLVGEPHRGIAYMFQMMNEARIMVGLNATATASVAYLESLAYAETRPQGRPAGSRDVGGAQVPIVAHPDVRRMLLRQKAIVDASLALVARAALYADRANHGDGEQKLRAAQLLDLLTPVAKSFPAEWGFESNALALQIHGGYGYSNEYLPEAWLRDQKLNSIHEGTTGIQGLDLLGRRVLAGGGASLALFAEEIASSIGRAREAGVEAALPEAVERALAVVVSLTAELGQKGLAGDVTGMLLHSADYLALFGILTAAWQHLDLAAEARRQLVNAPDDAFLRGKVIAATYWICTELPRVAQLAELVRSGEDSYLRVRPEEL
jgi:alkylation response protein AidB-like acyl-CoA dehydrogenase